MFDLYSNIERLAKEAGYKNITALCKEAGIPRSTLTELKKGRTQKLLPETANKIADALNVSLDRVYGRKELNLLPVMLSLFNEKEKPAAGSGELSGEKLDWSTAWDNATPEARQAALSVLMLGARRSEDQGLTP